MSGAREQVNRLLALVPYLQAQGEISVDQVAAEFGVTPATIRNDVNVLLFCGLPGLGMGDLIDLDFDAYEGEGVIRLRNADYLPRPVRLDSGEAAALMVALRPPGAAGPGAARAPIDRALAKMEAAAGEGAALAARVAVHLPPKAPEVEVVRAGLEEAIRARRQVRLGYYVPARDEATERVVDPLAVVAAEGHDYLDAWCHLAQDRRTFRLDRISAWEVLDTPVPEHAGLEPRDLSDGVFQPRSDDPLATLSLSPQARWVTEYYPVETVRELRDGSLTVTLRVGHPAWLQGLMLRLGGSARLVRPASLADQVRAAAERALANYAELDAYD
jgi:proteasome accessory factor C